MTGYFNVKLLEPEGEQRVEDIEAALVTEVLDDMPGHFLLRQSSWCRGRRTWIMIRAGREVRSRTDYILGTDCRLF